MHRKRHNNKFLTNTRARSKEIELGYERDIEFWIKALNHNYHCKNTHLSSARMNLIMSKGKVNCENWSTKDSGAHQAPLLLRKSQISAERDDQCDFIIKKLMLRVNDVNPKDKIKKLEQ